MEERFIPPLGGCLALRGRGVFHLFIGANTLGAQATLIAVRRGMPSNLFYPPTPHLGGLYIALIYVLFGFKQASENFEGRALRNCPVGNFSEGA